MTAESIWRERIVVWYDLFFKLGYEEAEPDRPGRHERSLVLAAVKRTDDGMQVKIQVDEVWLPGHDPQGLAPTVHGCYLLASSWNAHFAPGDVGQERRDLDRTHVDEEIHRHPLGEKNGVRQVLPGLGAPEDWLLGVEVLVAERQGF